MSLINLSLGFSAVGILIIVNRHRAPSGDSGAAITGGILGILLGTAFLIAACLHWKRGDRIQGGFRVEETEAAEIVSEMRQVANAMCSF